MSDIVFLLKQNSKEIRDEIEANGIDVCLCASFVGSIWLDYYPSVGDVHGLGCPYEGMTEKETLRFIEYDWKDHGTEVVECKDVHEFIKKILESKNGNTQ